MIQILIADDHDLFREGLRRVLEADERFRVVAEAGSTPEMLDVAKKSKPDVVLLDVSMPGRGGVEGLEEVKRLLPRTRVLMLTSHPEDRYAIRCLRAGADGYLTKDHASSVLIEAILKVHQGGKYITPSLAEAMAQSLGDGDEKPHEKLSEREFQVLRMMASGLSISEIGDELNLSVKTVSTYRRRLLDKLGFENNAELIRYALEENLVD